MTVATTPVLSNTLNVSVQPAFVFICQHIVPFMHTCDGRLVYASVLSCEVLICTYIE